MKGVLFTVMTFLLVFSLVGLASAFATTNLELRRDVNALTSADKLAYALESIKSQLQEATGVDVFKLEENVTFNDTIPRQNEIQNFLSQYGDFVDDKYEDPTLTIEFVDSSGNIINWENVDDATIRPFNITYTYPNVGKNSLEINALNTTELSHLERVDLHVRITGVLAANVTGWGPEHVCTTPPPDNVPPDCLPFRAIVTDLTGINQWDSGERNFKLDKQSAVQHGVVGGGFVRITVGDTGGGGRILQVEISGTTANTSTKLNFDTPEFSIVNDPARLRVYDKLVYTEADA